ncbi:hypothetical protein ACFPM0_19745 [Pseudonocardia sulfidoxydans]
MTVPPPSAGEAGGVGAGQSCGTFVGRPSTQPPEGSGAASRAGRGA